MNQYTRLVLKMAVVSVNYCLLCFISRVNVGTFGQCRYNRTLSYFLNNFSATSVVTAMCNPDKSQ